MAVAIEPLRVAVERLSARGGVTSIRRLAVR
jgi:hypothetical protein